MEWANIITLITAVSALIIAVVAWRKMKPEAMGLDADAATKYAELVDRAAKRECEYQNRIDAVELQVKALTIRQGELEREVNIANSRADKFEGWAKRLVHQVLALNGVPVPLDPTL
jgi:hypothetical protein